MDERYLIYRKQAALKKDQEFSFLIPVRFNVDDSLVVLELSQQQFKKNVFVELFLKNTQFEQNDTVIFVTLTMKEPSQVFSLKDSELITGKEYLLLGCRSNYSVDLHVSIQLI